MQRYLITRLLQSVALIFGVVVIVFSMVRLTGDPASLLIAREYAEQEQLEEMREALGLNRPLYVQFFDYLTDVLTGDLGYSLRFRQPAAEIIFEKMPITFTLASLALLLSMSIAIPLGILGGMFPNSWLDVAARGVGLFGQVIPSFWLALIFILFFSVRLDFFPASGLESWRSYILPVTALSVAGLGQLVRLTRSAVLEIRNEEYIRTARSKGLSNGIISRRHVFRNAAIALISVIGVQFTYALGGSIYIETIFAIPGLGWMLNEGIVNRDFVLVQSLTIFIATFAILMNLITDLLYAVIDPRIRYSV